MTERSITVLKSKIHRAKITEANLNYIGSITIDEALLEAAGIREYEKVSIVDINNGERLETYAIKGKRGSGVICLNGAAARKVAVGDLIIIICYIEINENDEYVPVVVFPNENNKLDPEWVPAPEVSPSTSEDSGLVKK